MSTWNGRVSLAVSAVLLMTTSVAERCGFGVTSLFFFGLFGRYAYPRSQATGVTRRGVARAIVLGHSVAASRRKGNGGLPAPQASLRTPFQVVGPQGWVGSGMMSGFTKLTAAPSM